jgi:hypothetical protein
VPAAAPEPVGAGQTAEPLAAERDLKPAAAERDLEPVVAERDLEPAAGERSPGPVVAGRPLEPEIADRIIEPAVTERSPEPDLTHAAAAPPAGRPLAAEDGELATIADPDPSWAGETAPVGAETLHAESAHDPEMQPVVPIEPMAPPSHPGAMRPETPVTQRGKLPDPASIVVPPAAKGPPVVEWAVSVTLVVALVVGMVIFRGPIMRVWPPSLRLYAVLGMGGR